MKRITIALVALLLALSFAGAQALTPLPLVAKDARSIAMGGAFTALSSGYQSLYGNPAGFALGRGMLTLANASMWGFVKPTTAEMDRLATMIQDASNGSQSAVLDEANHLITGNGLGAGAAVGLGWTGAGLGLGVTAVTEEYAHGLTLLGTQFQSATQVSVVAGMAITIGPKDFNLKIGGDLRPFARVDSTVPASDLIAAIAGHGDVGAVIMGSQANYGLGLAADLGVIGTMGPLSAGLAIRDIAPPFGFGATTIGSVLQSSSTSSASEQGQFLPNVSFGLGYSPSFIPGLIDPSLYFEVQDPVRALQDKDSLWNLLHVGGELRLLSFIYLRGGINQGWLTAGAGVNLLILEIDGALFTEELGHHPGDFPRSGFAANVRIHL